MTTTARTSRRPRRSQVGSEWACRAALIELALSSE
jgi:hypothetical protein